MRWIVGLGNPGPDYAGTRHNVGRMVVELLSQRWRVPLRQRLCSARVGEGMWEGRPLGLALPETMMNASGKTVGCLARRRQLEPADLLVVMDDVSLSLGGIRIRARGSGGGHLGLTSVLEAVGTEGVPRLRVGIGPGPRQGLTEFVLARFTPRERKKLEAGLEDAMGACEIWMTEGVPAAMNRFNRRMVEKR